MHQRSQRIAEVLAQSDEMARDVERLNAVAVAPSAIADAVELGWLRGGAWHGFSRLDFTPAADGTAVSLDTRLRELSTAVAMQRVNPVDRMERLAVLARWFYSGWRDGELLIFDDWEKPPYRKLVNAVSRVAQAPAKPRPSSRS